MNDNNTIDGNDIWELLFSIMNGNVPDELTEEVLNQLAEGINNVQMV